MKNENNQNEIPYYDEDLPLVPENSGCRDTEEFFYDEEGDFLNLGPNQPSLRAGQPSLGSIASLPTLKLTRPCSLNALNGSWYLQITPQTPYFFSYPTRGPMRIEVEQNSLRISGDIYVQPLWPFLSEQKSFSVKPITANPFIIRKNWYPHFPKNQYRWYFRSAGAYYSKGRLLFKFSRHLWDRTTEEFVNADRGWMEFHCETNLFSFPGLPQPTLKINGEAMIGGKKYNVTATKTSPYYRGCEVEVDVMQKRKWPNTATDCSGGTVSFTGTFRSSGLDFKATVDELNVPEDPSLTISELQNLMSTHRTPYSGTSWKLWLLVGSSMGGTYGIMFDTIAPHREGAAGFYDPTLPDLPIIQASARNKKLGEVSLAFLRTLIHEAGHAFNLYHPKHDVHGVSTGTTIMNQTGDVMGFATSSDPYPCNSTYGFNDHNRNSLIHSPDPQVKPGWKRFGWGHGSHWSGISYPSDVMGLNNHSEEANDLELELELPSQAFVGEVVIAKVSLTNIGNQTQKVTSALNLAQGDLRIHVTSPDGHSEQVRDVVLICGNRQMIELAPEQKIESYIQLYYTNKDFTFERPGRYTLQAELDLGDERDRVTKSSKVKTLIRTPINEQELDISQLMLDDSVGSSIALGDIGFNEEAQEKLNRLVSDYPNTDSGAAAAIVLANSLSRDMRDIRAGKVVRKSVKKETDKSLDTVMKDRGAVKLMSLATAIVSPAEKNAPVLDQIIDRIKKSQKKGYSKDETEKANKLLDDFRFELKKNNKK